MANIEVPVVEVVTIEELEKKTNNEGNDDCDDSDLDIIFCSDSKDQVSNYIVKSMVTMQDKVKGGVAVSPKEWKIKRIIV